VYAVETSVLTEEQQKESLIKRLLLFFTVIYAVQGLSQGGVSGLFYYPISFLLKDNLKFTPEQLAYFRGLVLIPWTIKPIYGLLSDFVPILGYRRRSYLFLAGLTASCAALYLAYFCDYSRGQLLNFLTTTALGIAFCDVVCDAVMIENGKRFDTIDKFQARQWSAISAAAVLSGIGGGFIAAHFTYRQTFLLMAVLPLSICIAALFFVPEKRYEYKKTGNSEIRSVIKIRDLVWVMLVCLGIVPVLFWLNSQYLKMDTMSFFRMAVPFLILISLTYLFRRLIDKKVLFCMVFLFWWDLSLYLSGSPFFFYMTDTLGFSKMFMGTLTTIGSGAAVFGAWMFSKTSRKKLFWGNRLIAELSLEKLLLYSVFIGLANIVSNFLMIGPKSAIALGIFFGFIFMFAHLTILVLAGKFCPAKIEGTFFALLMSVINLGSSVSELASGKLYGVFSSLAPKTLENNFWAKFLVWLGWPVKNANPEANFDIFALYYAIGWLIVISTVLFGLYFFAVRRFGERIKEEKELKALDISKLFSKKK
jgi:MFS family permease